LRAWTGSPTSNIGGDILAGIAYPEVYTNKKNIIGSGIEEKAGDIRVSTLLV